MATLRELIEYCNALLHPEKFRDFCTNGLQVEGKPQVSHLAVAVTASLHAIQEALHVGADCLLVHHGLFWQRDSYDVAGIVRRKLKLLLENDLSLIAYHLPLDAHPEVGNNWVAAQRLGWSNLAPFPTNDKEAVGVKGHFPPMEREAFLERLCGLYHNKIDVVFGGAASVSSAALISGGAHKLLPIAAAEGVDCYITGTRDEPSWHQAHEEAINFFAVGHAASEVIGPQMLGRHLAAHFDLTFTFVSEENPF